MHVQPDGGLVALAGMPTRVEELEPEPEDEDEMMDLWIDNTPLEMDYDDIATAGEADKSGEALQVSEGWLAVDCPDKLTSAHAFNNSAHGPCSIGTAVGSWARSGRPRGKFNQHEGMRRQDRS